MGDYPQTIITRVLPADDPQAIQEAAEALRRGELVVFPTDTVYGIGCDYRNPKAIEGLYWAKERPRHMAIPVLIAHPHHAHQIARDLPSAYEELAQRFWPGGLTLIVPKQPDLPSILCAGGDTVAIRMPNHPIALALIKAAGGAIAATSANRSGHPSPTTAQEALADLNGRAHLVLDGGPCPEGVASSIIDLTQTPPRLLRQGPIDVEALRKILPDLVVA